MTPTDSTISSEGLRQLLSTLKGDLRALAYIHWDQSCQQGMEHKTGVYSEQLTGHQ